MPTWETIISMTSVNSNGEQALRRHNVRIEEPMRLWFICRIPKDSDDDIRVKFRKKNIDIFQTIHH